MTRRQLLAATTAFVAAAQTRRPNVVVILADDLGAGDLSCYGATDLRTPDIDALAKSGIRFENFYANCPVCSPTRAALLTGLYPDCVGVPGVIRTEPRNSWGYLSPDAVLLPKILKSAGYHSAIVGKWHLGLESPAAPTERGFDHFHGFLGDMMDDYETHLRHGRNYMRRNQEQIEPRGHATDLFTQWAVDYLNSRKNETAPFFLYLAYNAPHTPVQPTAAWLSKVRSRNPEVPEKRARLAALIEHMDDGIGRIVEALKANGQYENTFVIFTSDNGGHLPSGGTAGPWRGGKEDMYEGGLRVPMCAMWPGHIKENTSSKAVAISMDIFPTVCEAARVRRPPFLDGVSLVPVLAGESGSMPQRDLIWMRREGGARYGGKDYYAVRRGRWKLLQNSPFEPYQLFNLQDDPREEKNMLQERPEIARELSAALAAHIQRAARTPWQAPAL